MEAIERQTSIYADIPSIEGSYRKLRLGKIAVTDPESFNHKLLDGYGDDRCYRWIEGYDFIAEERVLAPAGLVGFGPRYVEDSPYEINSSNGLASGNCFEEAMCHALCELLERDAWTLADLKSRWIPFALAQAVFGADAAAAFGCDDPNAYPRIDLQDAGEPILSLIRKFETAGLSPVVRDITSDFGIPCVMASAADDCVPGFPQAHGGMGTHPIARIAVTRALTELAQSRAGDIQSVREDLQPAGITVHPADRKMQRIQKIQPQRWMLQQAGVERRLRDMPSFENDDIADDIRLILSRLARNGIERVIVVDLSEPGAIFSVVRVLVPGLEFWALDQGKLGHRATKFWREHV
jgi:ribosomal protein S12 methylthiotransferase accessory factor